MFSLDTEERKENIDVPQGKSPLLPRKYEVLETPFTKKFK